MATLGCCGFIVIIAFFAVFMSIEGVTVTGTNILRHIFVFGMVDCDGGGDGL